jgi:hypothetical protein
MTGRSTLTDPLEKGRITHMLFDILDCTDEEYAKAEADPTYAPQEHKVGEIEAESYSAACRKVSHLIKVGTYRRGVAVVENTEERG